MAQHGGAVVSTVASWKPTGLQTYRSPGEFLRVCTFSSCLCGFPLGAVWLHSVFSHHPDDYDFVKDKQVAK